MEKTTITMNYRDQSINSKNLLKQNVIPVEFYGRGIENKSLQVDAGTFRRVFKKAGYSTILEVDIDGKETFNVLIHDVQFDPLMGNVMHVDLVNVKMTEELHTKLPLEFVGTAPAVKDFGGILTTHLDELEVKCLPKDLVHSFTVDISSLVDFNAYIRVKDLVLPPGITVLNQADDVIATVVPQKKEEEVAPVAAEVPAEGEAAATDASKEGAASSGDQAASKEK